MMKCERCGKEATCYEILPNNRLGENAAWCYECIKGDGMGMSRFAELARLKELEKQATSGKWSWSVDCENYQDGRGSSSADLEITDNRGCTVCTFIEYA